MGQSQSGHVEVGGTLPQIVAEESRKEIFSLWPGLEYHLELSFNSLDTEEKGLLPYEVLEPVLRHHLMQMGLIEYVTRFVTEEGKLHPDEVDEYLIEYGVNIDTDLDVLDWKHLMLAWIRRVHDAQEQDVQNWQVAVQKMQEEQAQKYQTAMRHFQTHYLTQLESYYKSIEDIHKKEEEYRHEWESNLAVQEEFYNMQMEYLHARNEAAKVYFDQQVEAQPTADTELLKHLKTGREQGPGSIQTIRFTYPVGMTSTGAPVSGGCQLPGRRFKKGKRGVCC